MSSIAEPPHRPRMSGRAVASLILSVISCAVPVALAIPGAIFTLVGLVPAIYWHAAQVITGVCGTVYGFLSLRDIRRGQGQGRGFAVTGIVLSVVATMVIMPAVQFGMVIPTVFEAKHQKQSMLNLKAIVTAMHKYHDEYACFPPSVVFDREGKPLYSWRVLLLPFLGQTKLYEQFKLDEPWDSPTNLPLLVQIPREYAPPAENFPPADGATHYLVFDGADAFFQSGERPKWLDDPSNRDRISGMQVHPQRPGELPVYYFGRRSTIFAITDGPSNTIVLVEADDRVPWSKPQDLPYAADQPLPKLGGHYHGDFVVAMADGAVRVVTKKASEKSIRAAITPRGGEISAPDWTAP
jgi:hypothetical protein